jgi:hypothetical protein
VLTVLIEAAGSSTGSNILDYINPLKYMSHEQYILIWGHLFNTVLQGFWAKLIASSSLFLAFFLGVYRQKLVMGVVLYALAVAIAYGGFIVKTIFSL